MLLLVLKMENALCECLGSNRQKLISTDRGGNDPLIESERWLGK